MIKSSARPVARPAKVSRQKAIDALREALLAETDEETSICKAAAEHGIFCRGFRQYGDNELRRKYDWIVRRRPDISRAELERIGNEWQLAQQQVHDLPLACDVQARYHDTCMGWDDFTDTQLAGFIKDLTGREIVVG